MPLAIILILGLAVFNSDVIDKLNQTKKETVIAGAGTGWNELMMSDNATTLTQLASISLFSFFLI